MHTPHGTAVLRTFLRDVCGCEQEWTPASIVDEQVARIRAQVGDGRAICGLSGGVDSSVAALIVHRALGDRLVCVLVDHGLLRKDEAEQVVRTFGEHFDVPLVHVDARERFLARLAGVDRPGAEAPHHRRGVHPRVRGGGGEARRRRSSSCRARSTRT